MLKEKGEQRSIARGNLSKFSQVEEKAENI
jgi:hypothetical protein